MVYIHVQFMIQQHLYTVVIAVNSWCVISSILLHFAAIGGSFNCDCSERCIRRHCKLQCLYFTCIVYTYSTQKRHYSDWRINNRAAYRVLTKDAEEKKK